MRRWFLSYHSHDQVLAEELKAAIERKDPGATVFFAPEALRAGARWAPAIDKAIAEATAFVLLVAKTGVGRWQAIEYDKAFDRHVETPDFPVVLMLLEGQPAPALPFLKQLHWIVSTDLRSEKDVLIEAVTSGSDPKLEGRWRYTSPYRGLAAMEEKDSDYFFGREQKTIEILKTLSASSGQIPVLLGASGVGKSSLAQAGVLAALQRQAWPEIERLGGKGPNPLKAEAIGAWPERFRHSRTWCFLKMKPGPDPIISLVEAFLEAWQFDATEAARFEKRYEWVQALLSRKADLAALIDATRRRSKDLNQPANPVFFLYIDQGEQLYDARGDQARSLLFSELIAHGVRDARFAVLMSMRSDFLAALQNDDQIFSVHSKIDVPAEQLSARFESDATIDVIARSTVGGSDKDSALPLLSYMLDDMWTEMVRRGDGVLRQPAFELAKVLADRANKFLRDNPAAEAATRQIFIFKLSTAREKGAPTLRRARYSEFDRDEWQVVSELADDPYRLLIIATPDAEEPYAEVAHEAIFRHWEKLRKWMEEDNEFLIWRAQLESDRRQWTNQPERTRGEALLMGLALSKAKRWSTSRADDIPKPDQEFIERSIKADKERKSAGLSNWFGQFVPATEASIWPLLGLGATFLLLDGVATTLFGLVGLATQGTGGLLVLGISEIFSGIGTLRRKSWARIVGGMACLAGLYYAANNLTRAPDAASFIGNVVLIGANLGVIAILVIGWEESRSKDLAARYLSSSNSPAWMMAVPLFANTLLLISAALNDPLHYWGLFVPMLIALAVIYIGMLLMYRKST